ncbi:MAG TPA: type IV secretion system protein, partial [Solirubrobacterales bacterium]
MLTALGVAAFLAAGLLHPVAAFASDVWGNISPAAPLSPGGLFGRYPLDHYTLDQHFTAVSVSLTGGVDVSGVLPMIAYFFAGALWWLTCFLANALITLFAFAFSLDLVNGSSATGEAGALAPVSAAIHSIYASVFGGPWLVLAISVVGIWAMWKALVQRRYSETAGALGLSLIYVVLALFFVAQPGATIGTASKWTNQMSEAFLAVSDHGSPSGGQQAKDDLASQLFDVLVFKPWTVLEFGGLEHCVLAGTGSENSDPTSAPVRPLSSSPAREDALARRLATGTEVSADGKACVNNANKYAPHFLRFGLETDERNAEYDALNHGDSSKLPEADTAKAGYRLGVADKPATDAMEAGGQYQRLLLALVIFVGELGAFCLLGALAVGIILAQVLLLLLLAFAPVALVAAVIPGRGHAFFKGWLEKLAGYLLRKAAYSLILAVLLAVAGALAGATAQLGWLMSFGLQALFFWAVLLQRKTLTESLIGIATGPGAPGRENTLRLLALYAGARTLRRPLSGLRRSGRAGTEAPVRGAGRPGASVSDREARKPGAAAAPP